MDDFLMLKSEYIGRKLATSGIVASGAMMTVNGQLTGAGHGCLQHKRNVLCNAGWKPYTIFGKSYEKAPDWMQDGCPLTSVITWLILELKVEADECLHYE